MTTQVTNRDGIVYALAAEGSTLVKIGYTGNGLARRLAGLQIGSPLVLRAVWAVAGGRGLEAQLHHRWVHLRRHGEWFEFAGLDPVAELNAAAPDAVTVPIAPRQHRALRVRQAPMADLNGASAWDLDPQPVMHHLGALVR